MNLQGVQKTIRWITRSMNLCLCFSWANNKRRLSQVFFQTNEDKQRRSWFPTVGFLECCKRQIIFFSRRKFFSHSTFQMFLLHIFVSKCSSISFKKVFINLTERVRVVIDKLVETTIDRGCLVKKLINCRLIKSNWKMVPVSIYKTYTNLANLTNAFNQSASGSNCSTDWGVLVVWTGKELCTWGQWYM